MKRKEFFTALSVSAGTVMFAPFLVSCSKGTSVADPGTGGTPGGTVDFTLDLSLAANSALVAVGGSVINSGVIIAHTASGYVAVASACTHQGAQLVFDNANNRFNCSNTGGGHGSQFSTTGSVTAGPAPKALKMYSTSLVGTKLRVFA